MKFRPGMYAPTFRAIDLFGTTIDLADYRQLMLGDLIFLNGPLAAIYGAELPKDAPFTKVQYQPEHRAVMPPLSSSARYAGASCSPCVVWPNRSASTPSATGSHV